MGKLTDSIWGSFEGKVGPVAGSSRKRIPYIKAAYKKRTKKVSAKELANRDNFPFAAFYL